MKDINGREITVGCMIAYPGRQSSSCWLSTGRVVALRTSDDDNTDNSAIKLIVGVDGRHHYYGDAAHSSTVPRWIHCIDQVVVISS